MKIALYIEDGLEQIVLTPESETETAILGKLHDGSRELSIKKGSFYHTRGGWQRYQPYAPAIFSYGADAGDESTMIVLRPYAGSKPLVETTEELARCEAREPDHVQTGSDHP